MRAMLLLSGLMILVALVTEGWAGVLSPSADDSATDADILAELVEVKKIQRNMKRLFTGQIEDLEKQVKSLEDNETDSVQDLEAEVSSLKTQLDSSVTNNLDTKTALEAAISSLKTQLEANLEKAKTALEADIFNLKTKLAAKRCESGYEFFRPNKQANVQDAYGTKRRTQTNHVTFSSSFRSIPKVTAGITRIDTDYRENTRINTDVLNLQASGFDLVVHDWDASVTYGVGIMWMACSN